VGSKRQIIIPETHPSLAGHFPHHPIVPGVVILNEVMESVHEDSSTPIRFLGVPAAKFLSPLRPGETLVIEIDEDGAGSTSFLCTVGARVVASGSLAYDFATAGPPPSS
jgi:3-hydroxymyristoyl/3-hydroxydecanoyl-(acyl carrier protein) dehydratase